jgi:hypothetical protein
MANRYAVKSSSVTLACATELYNHHHRADAYQIVHHLGGDRYVMEFAQEGVVMVGGWQVDSAIKADRAWFNENPKSNVKRGIVILD